jgi:predicted metal-dependent HD superfamily phosphohydrolase
MQRYSRVKEVILKKLKDELLPSFYYHSYHHTVDMHDSAQRIAEFENIGDHEKEVVLIAALFHDAGFIIDQENHEIHSCTIAREMLPDFDYELNEIDQICDLIMATCMPVNPQNHLQEIICDADLDYLGRNDFKEIGDLLFKELYERSAVKYLDEWNEMQIRFLTNHRYFTSFGQTNREAKKQENLRVLLGE